MSSLYAHFGDLRVAVGQLVHRETVLGVVGSSGRSTGPHLHFEFRVAGTPVDPSYRPRNRDSADGDDHTTQEEDFQATEQQFAADLAATLLCARIVKKVQDRERLSTGEEELYQRLTAGVLRSCSGTLVIDLDGRLRALHFSDKGFSNAWALGSPRLQ